MDATVFLAVLAAAFMHAAWNAVVKGAADPLVSVTHVSLFAGLVALTVAPLHAWPKPDAWIWLGASTIIHLGYWFMVVGAYRTGDMAQVYPIMRGAAPLMTAIATSLLLGETISRTGFAAVGVLSLGVLLMSFKGGRLGDMNGRAIAFALGSACMTCAYTLADGLGSRANHSGVGYAVWLFILNMIAMLAIGLALRGRTIVAPLAHNWLAPAVGGTMTMGAYGIALWGMTKAPIALVAALRETSVLFAALIAVTILKEPITVWRVAASLFVVGGIILLRLA